MRVFLQMTRALLTVCFEAALVGCAAFAISHVIDSSLPATVPVRRFWVVALAGATLHVGLELLGGNESWCRAAFR